MDRPEGPPAGPVFLTRPKNNPPRRQSDHVRCPLCVASAAPILAGLDGLHRHAEDAHPELANLEPQDPKWRDFVDKARRMQSKASTTSRGSHHRGPRAPTSDLNSVIPNTSNASQSGQQPRSTPGPAGTHGVESEPPMALSNLQINPSGLIQGQSTPRRSPPPTDKGRKRPANDGPKGSKGRRQRPRSSGAMPLYHPEGHIQGEAVPSFNLNLGRRPPRPIDTSGQDDPSSPATEPTEPDVSVARPVPPVQGEPRSSAPQQQAPVIQQESRTKGRHGREVPPTSPPGHGHPEDEDEATEVEPELLLQPETRPISQGQLVVEVRGIYAGLVLVEAKCIDVDAKQIAAAQEADPAKRVKLTAEQWRALIALHKTLLHEHHDFFLASQHPAATPMLSKLAEKYAMPSRMWRHAIHGFLEVLRYRLPESLEYMLAFVYIAYSMIALLYETVPSFENTWIECLGDLGRYRMSIEDDDLQDRETWSGVSRFWYSKAVEKSPKMGRLYHHLAILARPLSVQQLSLYARSLTCDNPFPSARVSVLTLFNPVLERRRTAMSRANPVELLLIRAHAIIFTGNAGQEFLPSVADLTQGLFEKYIHRAGLKFKEIGVSVVQANIGALLGYGLCTPSGVPLGLLHLRLEAIKQAQSTPSLPAVKDGNPGSAEAKEAKIENLSPMELALAENLFAHASMLNFGIFGVIIKRNGDLSMLPAVHVQMLFIWFLTHHQATVDLLQHDIPWSSLATFLNSILKVQGINHEAMFSESFPMPPEGSRRPLTEDWLLRGQRYADDYFPDTWFHAAVDEEERALELASMTAPRAERILWIAHKIAEQGTWILFEKERKHFMVTDLTRTFQPRRVAYPLSPHPLPAERGPPKPSEPKDVGSPASDTPSSSTLSLNPSHAHPFSSAVKGGAPVPSSELARLEDVEMLDAPRAKAEPVSPTAGRQQLISKEWLQSSAPDAKHPSKESRSDINMSDQPPEIVDSED